MKGKLQNIIIITLVLVLASCGGDGNGILELKLFPVKSGKEFQYIDREGKIIINPQFKEASIFREGVALVKTSGENPQWGFISEEGKFIIPANYKRATIFSEDLAWTVSENGFPKAINKKGEIKFTMQNAEAVKIFKEGLAAFSVKDSSGLRWGFVNDDGKVIINPMFSKTGNFSDSKCAVENSEGNWGYIDKEGKISINYQFNTAGAFFNGKAVVSNGKKLGVIDKEGKYLINPQYSNVIIDGDRYLIETDNKWGWCDKEGKIIINPQFEFAFAFGNNKLSSFSSDKKFGFIDKEGKIIINPQFDVAFPFNGKLSMVISGHKLGFIDKEGKYIINPQFEEPSKDLIYYLSGKSFPDFESIETDYTLPVEESVQADATDSLAAAETLLVEPESYSSSSILPTSSGFSYNSELVGDDDYSTWWSPSEKNKCWLQINFVNNVSINYIDILAGSHFPSYKNLGNLYLKNLRVKEIKLEFSDGTSEKLSLRDVDEVQKVEFRKRECKFVRISPLNYFPSEKWNDVCISYLKFGRGN